MAAFTKRFISLLIYRQIISPSVEPVFEDPNTCVYPRTRFHIKIVGFYDR